MRRVALRGLLARKTRLLLTALSVALGVTLIAGTYVFTDTINASFDRIFSASYAQTDIVVSPSEQAQLNETGDTAAIPASVRDRIAAVEGVEKVEGQIFDGGGTFLDKEGEPFSLQGPKFISSPFEDERFGGIEYAEGRAPQSDGEVALDKASAEREGFAVGDQFSIAAGAGAKAYTLVGLTQIEGVDSFGGTSVAQLTLPRPSASPGRTAASTSSTPPSRPGAIPPRSPAPSARRSRAHARRQHGRPGGLEPVRGDPRGPRLPQHRRCSPSRISLFVGAFIIFNTFSITVAQRPRVRPPADPRASRGQVLRSVLGRGPRARACSGASSASCRASSWPPAARAVQGRRLRAAVRATASSPRAPSWSRSWSGSS
jgi:putative ABC transport system permease protein